MKMYLKIITFFVCISASLALLSGCAKLTNFLIGRPMDTKYSDDQLITNTDTTIVYKGTPVEGNEIWTVSVPEITSPDTQTIDCYALLDDDENNMHLLPWESPGGTMHKCDIFTGEVQFKSWHVLFVPEPTALYDGHISVQYSYRIYIRAEDSVTHGSDNTFNTLIYGKTIE
ncbi:hypothetical protein ACFL58_01830 [Elusimicrobiota bacterium]